MPIGPKQHRVPYVASLCALAVMATGALILHQTLQNAADVMELVLWSIALAAIWVTGWLAMKRVGSDWSHQRPVKGSVKWNQRPVLFTFSVGLVFAIVSVIGALILGETAVFGGEMHHTTSLVDASPALVFAIAFVTGITEELFFRLGLVRLVPLRWFPLVSTTAYGIVTLASGNLSLTIAAVLLGLVSSSAFVITRRWYTPILIHVFWTVALVGFLPTI